MGEDETYSLPDWGPLVLSYAWEGQRGALEALLQLDQNLSRITRSVSEPALGQVRMAWWRDEILRERSAGDPQPPDPLLRSILRHWGAERSELVPLIDGWEHLLFELPLDEKGQAEFMQGRASAFAALARLSGKAEYVDEAGSHGKAWGVAELTMMGPDVERRSLDLPALPRELRALAIIGGLSRRSIKRGGAALFGDRLSPLAAMRLGIFGT